MAPLKPIRLPILSDTHDTAFPTLPDPPKIDFLLHCGDLTMIGDLSNYREANSRILAIPAELRLVIPGNHDVSLDPDWWAENLVRGEDDPKEPKNALELFYSEGGPGGLELLSEGIHKFVLEDGRQFSIYASPYTPEFGGYGFSYKPDEDRFNDGGGRIPDIDDTKVDIVMTHGPPKFPAEAITNVQGADGKKEGYKLDVGKDGEDIGCDKLFRALKRARPLIHCFGHIHEGYGAQKINWDTGEISDAATGDTIACGEGADLPIAKASVDDRGSSTLLVNAAIMRHGEEESNKPWIVDLLV